VTDATESAAHPTAPPAAPGPEPYLLRGATAGDFDALWTMNYDAYGEDGDEERRELGRAIFEPERSHLAVLGDEIAGHVSAFTRELSVPGGAIPAAHVSFVVVGPTHHRRGLLRRMITQQFDRIPESIAVLWASEGRIYQRFGYGMATRSAALRVNVSQTSLRVPPAPGVGTVRAVVPAVFRRQIQAVYERKRAVQPGYSSRSEALWNGVLANPEGGRDGYTAKHFVVFDAGDSIDGYLIWRTKGGWDESGGPALQTKIYELVATTPEAYAALWQFALTIDLSRTLHAHAVGAEEPIMYLVHEPRLLGATVGDGLWIRVLDLPIALAARRYAAPLDVVLEVRDAMRPANAGRWRLRVADDGSATCAATADEPDLACDIADLGAVYLGGTRLGQLAQAGRVRELRPDALRRADAAFSWTVAPTAIEVF
jgi:predicted acetyltransferase